MGVCMIYVCKITAVHLSIGGSRSYADEIFNLHQFPQEPYLFFTFIFLIYKSVYCLLSPMVERITVGADEYWSRFTKLYLFRNSCKGKKSINMMNKVKRHLGFQTRVSCSTTIIVQQ